MMQAKRLLGVTVPIPGLKLMFSYEDKPLRARQAGPQARKLFFQC